ncbi:hypothetical protein XELAEV_18021831mg [Xenopus laevis]|uniref:Uncharacterized protein n=1 Tax=Xenopus laevis TaxID=8355 RepID=A0A974HMN5_XENLA|nr:hypothetical protein XELAEV_18021831mg [Xenopus laevis]
MAAPFQPGNNNQAAGNAVRLHCLSNAAVKLFRKSIPPYKQYRSSTTLPTSPTNPHATLYKFPSPGRHTFTTRGRVLSTRPSQALRSHVCDITTSSKSLRSLCVDFRPWEEQIPEVAVENKFAPSGSREKPNGTISGMSWV